MQYAIVNPIEMLVCWHMDVYVYKHECAHYSSSKKVLSSLDEK